MIGDRCFGSVMQLSSRQRCPIDSRLSQEMAESCFFTHDQIHDIHFLRLTFSLQLVSSDAVRPHGMIGRTTAQLYNCTTVYFVHSPCACLHLPFRVLPPAIKSSSRGGRPETMCAQGTRADSCCQSACL